MPSAKESADGRKVYFQRTANQFVEYELATGKETVVFETGQNLPCLRRSSWKLRFGARQGRILQQNTARLSYHTGNDNWPDIFLY